MPSSLSLSVSPVLPLWLIALLAAGLLLLLLHGSMTLLRRGVPRRSILVLAGLRVPMVLLFVLILLQPTLAYTRRVEQQPRMLVLVDTSQSMAQPGSAASRLDDVRQHLEKGGLASTLARRFHLHWFAFDRTATPLQPGALSGLKAA